MVSARLSSLRRLPLRRLLFGPQAMALAVRAVEVLGKLGLYILAAALLGAHDSGLFFLAFTWVAIIATVARLGWDRAMVRYIAAELAVGQGRAAGRVLLAGLGWTCGLGAVAGLGTWLAADWLAIVVFSEPELAHPLALAALVMVPQNLTIAVGSGLTGLNRGVAAQFVQLAFWPVLTLAALAAGADSLPLLIPALAVAMTLSGLLGLAMILRDRAQFRDRPPPAGGDVVALPPIWRTALPLSVVEIVQVAVSSLPLLALGAFATAAEVGAFSIANRISMLIWVVIVSIATLAAPRFAEHHRLGNAEALRHTNRSARLTVAVLGAPAALLMLLFPGLLLRLVSPEFEIAALALTIMAAGQLVNCLLSCQDVLLAMTGHGRVLQWLNLAQLAVCALLSALLIPPYGLTGAALAAAVAIAQGAIGSTLAARLLLPGAWRATV